MTTTLKRLINGESKAATCERHGEYVSRRFLSHWSGCPVCSEEESRKEKEREAKEFAERWKSQQIAAATRDAQIPPRFESRTLDNYVASTDKQRHAHSVALEYADTFADGRRVGRSLIFCGNPGTGKTHLAIGIAHRAIADGYSAGFSSVMNAMRRVRESYRRDSCETERQLIEAFAKPDLLILDEVGVQRGTDDEKMILFDIINTRYEAIKPTIVISNLGTDGVREYLGDRAFDRLREGGGKAVAFSWESYRKSA